MSTPQRHTRPTPYVGVSGVTTPTQQGALLLTARTLGLLEHRALLLGVKATHKTQYLDTENKYGPAWYPVGATGLSKALAPGRAGVAAPGAGFGVAQVYLELDHVDDPNYRTTFTRRLIDRAGPWLDGIQFDMLPWHAADWAGDFLAQVKATFDGSVLLQCHGPAMHTLGPAGVIRRLAPLAEHVDYVLFDSSHGTGTRLDVKALGPFLTAAYAAPALAHVGIAVAGGLGPDTLSDLVPLLDRFPDLSFDAEGALHPVTDTGARPLSGPACAGYLTTAAHLLGTQACERLPQTGHPAR